MKTIKVIAQQIERKSGSAVYVEGEVEMMLWGPEGNPKANLAEPNGENHKQIINLINREEQRKHNGLKVIWAEQGWLNNEEETEAVIENYSPNYKNKYLLYLKNCKILGEEI